MIYIYIIYDNNNDNNIVIIPCSEGLFCPFIGESPMTAGGPGAPMANPSTVDAPRRLEHRASLTAADQRKLTAFGSAADGGYPEL